MHWLNYHHLYFFWVISQEGSLLHAAKRLHLTPPTLSAQLKKIEEFFGQELFDRKGHRSVLTHFGAEVAQYATDIFHLGHELVEMARGHTHTRRSVFRVGVVGSIPKTVVYRLVEPSMEWSKSLAFEFRQGNLEDLLGLLSRNLVHVILADQPPKDALDRRVHTHKLGETDVILYGTPRLAMQYHQGFPISLAGAPMLLPAKGTSLRQSIDKWLAEKSLEVRIVGEFDSAELLRTFGAFQKGLFPVRSVLASEIEETYAVEEVGPMTGVRETYYAISQERKVTHPYILAIIDAAKHRLLVA
jgi:LysR family transcriptional activator of nhaA